MNAMLAIAPDETHASLQLVVREVAAELNEARAALEAYAENAGDRAALHRFGEHLHVARGALRMAEVYGGALLGEEMEQVVDYLESHERGGQVDADGLDALMRAMEQLPAYVDRVASGGRDVPLALLPLLNDLRAVRGGALLSEGTLLMLNLRSDEPARPGGDVQVPAAELARKLRPRLQLALLGWIRNEQVAENLGALSDIAGQFEQAATTQPLFQLWWVVAALIESLQQGGIDGNVSVKRLLGQVDRELRRLQEQGEARYSAAPPIELLNNLLFYVARSFSSGARVLAVRRSFRLDEVLGVDEQVSEAQATLSAPSVRLMKTVAAAIREDLTRVKDVLDIFVRRGATQVDELAPQLEMLRKISDTLGVLGLGALRDRVQEKLESLAHIVERREPPGDAALLDIASALIEVEDSLDAQLVKLIVSDGGTPEGKAAGAVEPGEPTDEEFKQVQDAVLRECIVNMARIKEAVTHALAAPSEAQGLDQVPQLVRGITAGLLMLGKQRAVEVMESVGRALGAIVRPDAAALAPQRLDSLADAIVAVEYYKEMLQAGRPVPWHMLETAQRCLVDLEEAPAKVVALRPARPQEEPAAAAPPVTTPSPQPEAAASPTPVPPLAPAAVAISAPAEEAATAVDPEFRQLFVEEARENILVMCELFPQWESNPLDVAALRDLRRVFHTLKGSGRMVGARRVSEFSWSIEALLNRVISQTLPRSPEIVVVVRDAVAAMPKLVDELEHGRAAQVDAAAIVTRADTLAGRETTAMPPAAAATAAPQVAAQGEVAVAAAGAEPAQVPEPAAMDPVLRDIFRKETAGHVEAVREYIARCAEAVAPYAVTEALYRACHTLSGIAKTAGARQGIKVAEPMEDYVRKLHDNGRGLPEEGLLLLRDTVQSLETVVDHVEEDTGYFPDQGRLIAGWHALDRALDAELARQAEAGEAAAAESWAEEPAQLAEAVPQEAPAAVAAERETAEPRPFMPELPAAMPEPAEARFEVPSVPAAPEPAAEIEPDFDADIAAIFGEESSELLELADSSLASWTADRADRSRITELKRVLHTLKGGARMAGIRAMGDLSHEIESFLASLEAGSIASGEPAIAVLQAALDELHRMREAANAGQRIAPARSLIERVRAVASSSAAPAPAPETPAVVAPPAAAAPADELAAGPVVEPAAPPMPTEQERTAAHAGILGPEAEEPPVVAYPAEAAEAAEVVEPAPAIGAPPAPAFGEHVPI